MIKIDKKAIYYLCILGFTFSKFFYFQLFAFSSYNFTLSDFFLVTMLISLLNRRTSIPKPFFFVIYLSMIILALIIIGSTLQSTSVSSSIINFIKRWMQLLVLPVFIYTKFDASDIYGIVLCLVANFLFFFVSQYKEITLSLGIHQYIATFNPNTLGLMISVLFIVGINRLPKDLPTLFKLILITLYGVTILSVASRGAILALIPTILTRLLLQESRITLRKITVITGIIIVGLAFNSYLVSFFYSTFTYSLTRFYNTLMIGIINDPSASARLSVQALTLSLVFSDILLLLFGMGFGNSNMTSFFYRYGLLVNTTDSFYVNSLAWFGLLGSLLFGMIIISMFRFFLSNKHNPYRSLMIQVMVFMLFAGVTQDTFIEPTIGSFFMILSGVYYLSDKEYV